MFELEFAVIDIETSGGKPKDSRIIEIAIVIHDGQNIIEEYQTLVNPEKKIDWYVSKLTGISNKDVEKAPKFFEVAKTIHKLITDRVFVAHNIGFDYPIVRNEFKSLGLDLRLPHMCTIQTSRVLIPGLESYGLKNLSQHLEISLTNHHRAMDDTMATVEILKHLYSLDKNQLSTFIKNDVNPTVLNPNLDLNAFDDIPNKTGIYFFYNQKDELIYIGKSIHIKKRIEQHLKNDKTDKAIRMRSEIARIKYKLTGSELLSLLMESELIKKEQPIYNKAQRANQFNYGLYSYLDGKGYLNLTVKKNNSTEKPIQTFTTSTSAKSHLEGWVKSHQLCQKLGGLYTSNSGCFNYSINECDGACIGKETAEQYNSKVNTLIEELNFNHRSFIILDKGKIKTESSFVVIENGDYIGYGFAPGFILKKNVRNFKKYLKKQESNRDFKSIINLQLTKNEKLEIIEL